MIIAPGTTSSLQQTRNSRELARRLEQAVRDYRREHPETTEAEVRAALMQSVTPDDDEGLIPKRRYAAIGMVVAVGLGVLITSLMSPGRSEGSQLGWQIFGALAAVLAVGFSVVRIARGGRISRW